MHAIVSSCVAWVKHSYGDRKLQLSHRQLKTLLGLLKFFFALNVLKMKNRSSKFRTFGRKFSNKKKVFDTPKFMEKAIVPPSPGAGLPWIWNFPSISISISTDFPWISMDISMDIYPYPQTPLLRTYSPQIFTKYYMARTSFSPKTRRKHFPPEIVTKINKSKK